MWSIRPDGSDLRQVSPTTGESLWYPRMMLDGKALYAWNGTGTAIMPFNADGTITRVEPLPPMPAGGRFLWPRLSPDGTAFVGAFARQISGEGIWKYTIATKQYERLSDRGVQPIWINNETILYHDGMKAFTLDTRTKTVRPFVVPAIRAFGNTTITRDLRTILVDERADHSVVWLMKSQ